MIAQTVTGSISIFNTDTGVGFAETNELDGGKKATVLFRQQDARKVILNVPHRDIDFTFDQPVAMTGAHMFQKGVYVVMEVSLAKKGWVADKWGIYPGPGWIHNFIKVGTMDAFIHGNFEVAVCGMVIKKGVLESVKLTPASLTESVQTSDGLVIPDRHSMKDASYAWVGRDRLLITTYSASEGVRQLSFSKPGS